MITGSRWRLGLAAVAIGVATVLGIVGLRLGGAPVAGDPVADRPPEHDAPVADARRLATDARAAEQTSPVGDPLPWVQRRRSRGRAPVTSSPPASLSLSLGSDLPKPASGTGSVAAVSRQSPITAGSDEPVDQPSTASVTADASVPRPLLPARASAGAGGSIAERRHRRGGGADPFAIGPWRARPRRGLLEDVDASRAVDTSGGIGVGGASTWFKKPPLDADG